MHLLAAEQQELVGASPEASAPQGRFAFGADAVNGRTLEAVDACGKHIHHRYEGGQHLHVHLGGRGKWLRLEPARAPWPQVQLRLAVGELAWDLISPAVCELLDADGWARLVASMGPDPLRPDADPEAVWNGIREFSGLIGAALRDQSVIAGVGTLMSSEILFDAGIHPRRTAASVTREECGRLWSSAVRVMGRAVDIGRAVTVPVVDDQHATRGERDLRMVYEQDRCRACGGPIEVETIDGRTSYACPFHQPPPL